MSIEEQQYNPILNNPSIFLGSDWTATGLPSIRSSIPTYSDVLNSGGTIPKYRPYISDNIEQLGMYSLASWNLANGNLQLKCFVDGTGWMKLDAKDLIPFMPYTVWGVFGISDFPSQDAQSPVEFSQFGGVPTAFYSDKNGDGSVSVNLPYCPLDSNDPLMYVALGAHWDFVVAGASFYSDRPAGTVSSEHLCFTVADYI